MAKTKFGSGNISAFTPLDEITPRLKDNDPLVAKQARSAYWGWFTFGVVPLFAMTAAYILDSTGLLFDKDTLFNPQTPGDTITKVIAGSVVLPLATSIINRRVGYNSGRMSVLTDAIEQKLSTDKINEAEIDQRQAKSLSGYSRSLIAPAVLTVGGLGAAQFLPGDTAPVSAGLLAVALVWQMFHEWRIGHRSAYHETGQSARLRYSIQNTPNVGA